MNCRRLAALDPIDTHVHAFQSDPAFADLMARLRLHVLDICVADTHGIYGDLATELLRAKDFVRSSQNHARICVTFDPFGFEQKDFAQNIVKQLRQEFAAGAVRSENLEKHWDGAKDARQPLRHARRCGVRTHLPRNYGRKQNSDRSRSRAFVLLASAEP